MFFAPNPGVLAAGVSTGKTYAEWVAHATTLAAATVSWTGGVSGGNFNTTAAPVTSEVMTGTPWGNRFRGPTSAVARMIQHALPSEAEFLAQVADARVIYFKTSSLAVGPSYVSLSRNGYTSLANGATGGPMICTDVKFWTPSGVFSMNPNLSLGPFPYDW